MTRPFAWMVFAAIALSGCATSMSGIGGNESYACKAPEGVLCMSVSGVYANSSRGPARPAEPSRGKSAAEVPSTYGASPVLSATTTAAPSNAIRSNPRLLRVWVAPWEDSDGDLHEAGYLHVLVDTGRWLVEHVRPAPRSDVDGVAPPPALPEAAPSKPAPAIDGAPPER